MADTSGQQAIDLAIILDRVADDETFDRRSAFAADLVRHLAGEMPDPGLLRVALLGYGGASAPVTEQFAPWETSESKLNGLKAIANPGQFRFDAPLEGALLKLETLSWREGARRVLITIGSRPPRPQAASPELLLPANSDGNWATILRRLHGRSLASIAILCPVYWPGTPSQRAAGYWNYLVECWAELGYNGMYEAETITPAQLARAISVGLE